MIEKAIAEITPTINPVESDDEELKADPPDSGRCVSLGEGDVVCVLVGEPDRVFDDVCEGVRVEVVEDVVVGVLDEVDVKVDDDVVVGVLDDVAIEVDDNVAVGVLAGEDVVENVAVEVLDDVDVEVVVGVDDAVRVGLLDGDAVGLLDGDAVAVEIGTINLKTGKSLGTASQMALSQHVPFTQYSLPVMSPKSSDKFSISLLDDV